MQEHVPDDVTAIQEEYSRVKNLYHLGIAKLERLANVKGSFEKEQRKQELLADPVRPRSFFAKFCKNGCVGAGEGEAGAAGCFYPFTARPFCGPPRRFQCLKEECFAGLEEGGGDVREEEERAGGEDGPASGRPEREIQELA